MLGKINAPRLTRIIHYPGPRALIITGLATGEADIEFCRWASKTGRYAKRSLDDLEIEILPFERLITIKQAKILYYESRFDQTGGQFTIVIQSKDRELYSHNRHGDHHFIHTVGHDRPGLVILYPKDWHYPFKPKENQWQFRIIRDELPDIHGDLEIDYPKLSGVLGQKQFYQRIGQLLLDGLNLAEAGGETHGRTVPDFKLNARTISRSYNVACHTVVGTGFKADYVLKSKLVSQDPLTGIAGEVEFMLTPSPSPEEKEMDRIWTSSLPVALVAGSWIEDVFSPPQARILTMTTVDGVVLQYAARINDPESLAKMDNIFQFAKAYHLKAALTDVSDNNLTLKNGIQLGSYSHYIGKQITTNVIEYLFGREADKIYNIELKLLKGLVTISTRLVKIAEKAHGAKELMEKHGWNERAYELWTISLGLMGPYKLRHDFEGYLLTLGDGTATYNNLAFAGESMASTSGFSNTFSYVLQKMISFGTDYFFLLLP